MSKSVKIVLYIALILLIFGVGALVIYLTVFNYPPIEA